MLKRVMIYLTIVAMVMVPLPIGAQDDDPPPPLVELNEVNIKQATVFVMQVFDAEVGPIITCVGSGTLVSADGLILTNAHIAVENGDCRHDRLVIALTLRVDEPPVPTYVAEIVDFNLGLDLAVLQITRFLDGRIVEQGSLQLPFVELGDSSQVDIDDTILIVGYPDIGTTAVTTILGNINGFTAEARVGDRAWLRTSAPIPGGISGGGAYDSNGRLIGIPTISPARFAGEAIDCRRVQDSTGDGQVDTEDICIPIGGFISAMRPSRLARGLVRASALGIQLSDDRSPAVFPPPTDPPEFSRLFVSTGVNVAGMPVNVATGLPAGSTSLYLYFDYDNMVDGMVYELRTSINGRPSSAFSLPPVTWNGGPTGMWYIGSSGVPWPNGTYEFTLFIEGRQVASHQITIGGGAQQVPNFSDISFALQDATGDVSGNNFIIPETNIVRAEFLYRNMQLGMSWRQEWYLGDARLTTTEGVWEGEAQGISNDAAISSPEGLLSGRYRLELYIEDRLAATSDFVIAGGAEGTAADIFSNFRFSTNQIAGLPQQPISDEFPTGVENLYVFFNWRQLSIGTPWTWRWKVDNDTLIESNTQWAAEPTGENYYIALAGEPNLPDATYTFEIEIGGIIVATSEVRVGLGQLPLDVFASAAGVQVVGTITDVETGDGIPGALFIILLPEFSVEDFLWEEEQVLGMVLADSEGFFQLPVLLPRGTAEEPILYSMLIRAEGYLPMQADGIAVTDFTESPLALDVELNRD